MEKNPIVEMRIFTMHEDQIMKSLKRHDFKDIEVKYGAPEPLVSFTGKYKKAEAWCEDNVENGFNLDDIELMKIDGEEYSMDQVDQDEKGRWYSIKD